VHTLSRCIIIGLKRRKPTEAVEGFGHIDDDDLGDLRRQAMRWTMDHIEALKAAFHGGNTGSIPVGRASVRGPRRCGRG
jgi:hypothetical protein